VLEQSIAPAGIGVAEALGIAEGETVFVLKRLRLAGDEPMGIQTAHIPLSAAPGLPEESFENVSLYDLLQTKYGVHLESARESYQAALAGEQDALMLQIPTGAPVFAAERVASARGGKPFEFVRSIMRGDRYRIVLNLVK
jgi:GntR family transcriptional regulator